MYRVRIYVNPCLPIIIHFIKCYRKQRAKCSRTKTSSSKLLRHDVYDVIPWLQTSHAFFIYKQNWQFSYFEKTFRADPSAVWNSTRVQQKTIRMPNVFSVSAEIALSTWYDIQLFLMASYSSAHWTVHISSNLLPFFWQIEGRMCGRLDFHIFALFLSFSLILIQGKWWGERYKYVVECFMFFFHVK